MGDLLATLVVIIIFSLIIYKMRSDKKKGIKCGGCTGCSKVSTCTLDHKEIYEIMKK